MYSFFWYHRSPSKAVLQQISRSLQKHSKKFPNNAGLARVVRERTWLIHSSSINKIADAANAIAPEHLQIMVKNPQGILKDIKHAGAIFVGSFTPTAVGDYVAGPSHVLPTNGTARFFSGICIQDFLKSSHIISYSRRALEKVKDSVEYLAKLEGLPKHMESVKIRFDKK